MARETILSPSHYRLTAFLFSYYSPVKTSGGGGRARGGGGGYTPHSSLLKNFIRKKKRRGSQNIHLSDAVTARHGTMQRFVRCCSHVTMQRHSQSAPFFPRCS